MINDLLLCWTRPLNEEYNPIRTEGVSASATKIRFSDFFFHKPSTQTDENRELTIGVSERQIRG